MTFKKNSQERGNTNNKKNTEINASGWDAITLEFERIYPGQNNPKHYGTIISYELGGQDPLKGISIYDAGEFVKSEKLKWICVISPIFGGAEDKGNQILATPEAEQEKRLIDKELQNYLKQGRSIKDFHVNFEYKGKSIIPTKIIIKATIDEEDYNKIIEVW